MISNSIEQKRMKYTNFILFALLHSWGKRVGVRCSQFFFQKNLMRQNNRKGLSVNPFYTRMTKKIFAREMAYPSEMGTASGGNMRRFGARRASGPG